MTDLPLEQMKTMSGGDPGSHIFCGVMTIGLGAIIFPFVGPVGFYVAAGYNALCVYGMEY